MQRDVIRVGVADKDSLLATHSFARIEPEADLR
jgi:hypothetical protein